MFVDSHCHINFPDLRARLPELLAHMRENRVTHALCISVTLEDFPSVLEIAEQEPNIYATVGVHPDAEADWRKARASKSPRWSACWRWPTIRAWSASARRGWIITG